MSRRIDGNATLYHYLQKVIVARDNDFSRQLIQHLVVDLSIWVPADVYREIPILLPYCLRDPSVKSGEWGSANAQGYLRDNNSLLKQLVGGWTILSPFFSVYHRAVRGHGFTACHSWRKIRIDGTVCYSASHPKTYSFVPNLAWLPTQIAKLTDHEGSRAQHMLQTISRHLYAPAAADHPPFLANLWQALPPPALDLELDLSQLNIFRVTPRGIKIRKNNLLREMITLQDTLESGAVQGRSARSRRYLTSLLGLPPGSTSGLQAWLGMYQDFLTHS